MAFWVGRAGLVTFFDWGGGGGWWWCLVSFSKTIKKKKRKVSTMFGTRPLFLKLIACKQQQQQQQQQPNVRHNNIGYVHDNRIFISPSWDAVRR